MSSARFHRAARRREVRVLAAHGDIPDEQRRLTADNPSPSRRPELTTKNEGLRMLQLISTSGVVEPLTERLNGLVDDSYERRLLGPRPGQRSRVTVPIMLLAILLCALTEKCYRRSDVMRVLSGLHGDVAKEVELLDDDGKLSVGNYKTVLRQIRRMEQVLRDGWTVVEHEGTPHETRTLYDMGWFVRSLIGASVPDSVLAQVHHVAIDATNINSWANFLPGVGKSDAEQEPFAARAQKVAEKDTDTIPEPDLNKHQRELRRKYPWIQFGPDGRAIYTADEDVRVGHRSANSEGAAGKFLGFDLHALVAAPTVVSNGSRNSVTLEKIPSYIVGMELAPALTACGPIASRLVLETRRELCPNIADATGDRGYSQQHGYARPLHREGINVFMDYRSDVLRSPKPVTLGQTKHEVFMHAGMLLSADTPDDQLVLPAPPATLATTEERTGWKAKWYADRAKTWGWSAKKHHGDGRVQFRSPSGAGRVAPKRATAASGNFKAPYRPSSDPPTATALVEQLDTWQRLAFGTSAWARAYYAGRSAVENVFSRVKEHGALARGTCQAFGLAANTIAVMARVVIYNLHKSDSIGDDDDGEGDEDDAPTLRGGSPQPPDPRLEPDKASTALRAPP